MGKPFPDRLELEFLNISQGVGLRFLIALSLPVKLSSGETTDDLSIALRSCR